ncbi:Fe-S cluster biogenesis protein NfuA, 4Fe-4S-binding domain [Arthrobacter sp. 49Tsu3.1M3]|uniref:NifU family protein n=1 Tax=Arthrobacter sp. 49Tsu3.1M3 TaxID=1279029 RepID=UPI0009A77A85|nr:NifU family protein [Arthrobacter sp. 49Tsu3.1M3]SKB86577.1 Fe-S cluster biogenesis protein NfuA, 4Fe-4S-binding domain [Arthrobacter sp. 49Tsu3.1M3]
MDRENLLGSAGERISSLLDVLGSGGPVARDRAEELVRQVTELYGAGLERILHVLDSQGALGPGTVSALTSDPLVSGLLLIHGLHPVDLSGRVAGALDSVRPYLGSHGGDVELLGISEEGVVRLRLLGSCQGCPSSSVTLKLAVEDAIESAAPEVTGIEVEEAAPAAVPALIPVGALRSRLDGLGAPPDGGTRSAAPGWAVPDSGTPASGTWQAVPALAELESGAVAGFLVAGVEVLTCRIGPDVYAFVDRCPRCTHSMPGASLQRALAAPVGGGLLRCPHCRSHFDVRKAGACLEDKALHLDPLPLLLRDGVPSVAVPTTADPL